MALSFIKIHQPKKEQIIKKSSFVANQVYPISIKESSVEGVNNVFATLFFAKQDYDNDGIFFSIFYHTDNNVDIDILRRSSLYFHNITSNDKKLSMYKDAIKTLSNDNFYTADLIMKRTENHQSYYKTIMIKPHDKDHVSILEVFFPREIFLRLKIYLDRFASLYFEGETELVCVDPKYNNIKAEKIESVKYDCSTRMGTNIITSHFTMNCGPTTYKINNMITLDKDHEKKILANPLNQSLYMNFYQQDTFISDVVKEDEDIYWVILPILNTITHGLCEMKALMLSKELIDKTNLLNPYNRIFLN